jgi:hypothetical protein
MKTEKKVDAKTVAREFSKVLHSWLSKEEMALVVARNAAQTDALICHSHDFCDANMAMAEAFSNLGLKTAADLSEGGENPEWDASVSLWNEAWGIAKAAQFDASKIV